MRLLAASTTAVPDTPFELKGTNFTLARDTYNREVLVETLGSTSFSGPERGDLLSVDSALDIDHSQQDNRIPRLVLKKTTGKGSWFS